MMMTDTIYGAANLLSGKTIGMAGFGHLGSSIGRAFIANGMPPERIAISCAGSERTLAAARELGVAVYSTKQLALRSDFLILAARPQELGAFAGLALKKEARVLSFMAGVTNRMLSKVFSAPVKRAMCSGPETIGEGRGVGAVFPTGGWARALLEAAGLSVFDAALEEELDAFTVAICIPPILQNVAAPAKQVEAALQMMAQRYAVCGKLAPWIRETAASAHGAARPDALKNVSTKGGVTEAMTAALAEGADFSGAVEAGLRRNGELAARLGKLLEDAA